VEADIRSNREDLGIPISFFAFFHLGLSGFWFFLRGAKCEIEWTRVGYIDGVAFRNFYFPPLLSVDPFLG